MLLTKIMKLFIQHIENDFIFLYTCYICLVICLKFLPHVYQSLFLTISLLNQLAEVFPGYTLFVGTAASSGEMSAISGSNRSSF